MKNIRVKKLVFNDKLGLIISDVFFNFGEFKRKKIIILYFYIIIYVKDLIVV